MVGGGKDVATTGSGGARSEDAPFPAGLVNFVVRPPRPERMPDERPV
jgi:hypothetical protein